MKEKIVFDCERMKHPHTGLYYYCYYLGKHLLLENQSQKEICFYLPKGSKNVFGKEVCSFGQNSLHKTYLPIPRNTRLWHSTYQGTNYFPPGKDFKIVLTIHDLNFMYNDAKGSEKRNRYMRKLEEKIERADALVFISNYVKEDLSKYINLNGKHSRVIYNGVSLEELEVLAPPVIKPLKPFLFTIGTIVEKKNFHVLPSLLVNNDLDLVIAGITQSEEYKQAIIEEAKKYKVADRIVFTGVVDENDKQWYYKNCEVFVFPSVAEGFGLPVVEAMYFGKNTILSSTTSLPEVGGRYARYFTSFNPEHMQQTLADVLNDNANNEENIRAWSSRFKWSNAAKEYLQLYDDVLNKNSFK